MIAPLSSALSSLYVVAVWLFAVALFFAAVFSLAKIDTPGGDLISFFAFTSGWEGALLWGGILLLLHHVDKQRDELDAADALDAADEAKDVDNHLNDESNDNGIKS